MQESHKYVLYALFHVYVQFFLKNDRYLRWSNPHESLIWLGGHVVTRQLTHDPAMNPVTASVTFGVNQFLADNVDIAATRANMLPTFPTKAILK